MTEGVSQKKKKKNGAEKNKVKSEGKNNGNKKFIKVWRIYVRMYYVYLYICKNLYICIYIYVWMYVCDCEYVYM